MAKLSVFNFISLDGYYKGLDEEISWHNHGEEETQYSVDSLKPGNTLLFGRVTYEVMKNFWPMPDAIKNMPEIARSMNSAEKIVFSNTLNVPGWNNVRIISGDIVEAVRKLKQTSAKDLTILGSGTILSQFTDAGLIDRYEIMLSPVALGSGVPLFKGIKNIFNLKLVSAQTFKSGTLLLNYEPLT